MKKTMLLMLILLAVGCNNIPLNNQSARIGHEPTWPFPEGAVNINLSQTEVTNKGELIKMNISVHNLKLLQDESIPKDFAPLIIVLEIETPNTIRFSDGKSILEHAVDVAEIGTDGSYTFSHELIGYRPGNIGIVAFWKWPILTEGCCSTALLAILAGCGNSPACICATMAAMPAPGSWCCSIHPKVFRLWWSIYACTGASPY